MSLLIHGDLIDIFMQYGHIAQHDQMAGSLQISLFFTVLNEQ